MKHDTKCTLRSMWRKVYEGEIKTFFGKKKKKQSKAQSHKLN